MKSLILICAVGMAFGQLLRSIKSEARTKASQENGRKGGRPKGNGGSINSCMESGVKVEALYSGEIRVDDLLPGDRIRSVDGELVEVTKVIKD